MDSVIPRLVDQFAHAAIRADEGVMHGSVRIANRYNNELIRIHKEIAGFGDDGREHLSHLLCHEHPSVRSAAAAVLLKHRTVEALSVLKELATGEGLVAFKSGEAIKRWEEGSWNLE